MSENSETIDGIIERMPIEYRDVALFLSTKTRAGLTLETAAVREMTEEEGAFAYGFSLGCAVGVTEAIGDPKSK